MIVVSDTTPIISLIKVSRLDLLQLLYGTVSIPESVYNELVQNPRFSAEAKTITDCQFIRVEKVADSNAVSHLQEEAGLDIGESESIILYNEKSANLLLMDEIKGRKTAKRMNISCIGTLGMLMLAYDRQIMNSLEIQKCISIMQDSGIRLSSKLCKRVMEYVGLNFEL